VTQMAPAEFASKGGLGSGYEVVIFDSVTPVQPPRTNAIYLDPRSQGGAPVKVGEEIVQPGFDKIDRKHPTVRFTALDDVNVARGHKLTGEPGDKVVGASEGSPILIAGTRGGSKFVALGFDVRDSDLPLRVAWPLFLLNTINWFTDEDASYLSSFRTGDVWRIPVGAQATTARLKMPGGGEQVVPVHEGRAVFLGERAGFYEMAPRGDGPFGQPATPDPAANAGAAPAVTAFAANLLDETESTIAPAIEIRADGKVAGKVEGFHVGVRREIWIYLLLAVALLTAVEWATYHRRITV